MLGSFAMRLRVEFLPMALALLGAPVGAAQAGPVHAPAGAFAGASLRTPVAARCGRKGQVPCRVPRGAPFAPSDYAPFAPSDYYVHDANKLPVGSERWRDQMRRENRLGNPG